MRIRPPRARSTPSSPTFSSDKHQTDDVDLSLHVEHNSPLKNEKPPKRSSDEIRDFLVRNGKSKSGLVPSSSSFKRSKEAPGSGGSSNNGHARSKSISSLSKPGSRLGKTIANLRRRKSRTNPNATSSGGDVAPVRVSSHSSQTDVTGMMTEDDVVSQDPSRQQNQQQQQRPQHDEALSGIPESTTQPRSSSTSSTALHPPPQQRPDSWSSRQYAMQLEQWDDRERTDSEIRQAGRQRRMKERDGFCRRVDDYDGRTIVVDGKAAYELGNYLGDGVAGVVYEGHRTLPAHEYPVRTGVTERLFRAPLTDDNDAPPTLEYEWNAGSTLRPAPSAMFRESGGGGDHHSTASNNASIEISHSADSGGGQRHPHHNGGSGVDEIEETVAVKILNPVGFKLLNAREAERAVVVRRGEPMSEDVRRGLRPMADKHVWWLVSPSSRNLRTLLRTTDHPPPAGTHVDRGSADRGLRISLVAAHVDPETDRLRELPLTRCIEIWGHAPFGASEAEFEDMMDAIEKVNDGRSSPPSRSHNHPARGKSSASISTGYSSQSSVPSRTPTDYSENDNVCGNSNHFGSSVNTSQNTIVLKSGMNLMRSGLSRAAQSERSIAYNKDLNAHIAIPAVPPKYLRWLRQRRAVTKEIRNMMRIGRHKNVVHLYEVLELIQDSKSTMFLIIELVRGGELFDLISSNASSPSNVTKLTGGRTDAVSSEKLMLKFFKELASGISYCHASGIAHRDLKPENLLVHNSLSGDDRTLKIADFGLSAAFAITRDRRNDYPLGDHNSLLDGQTASAPTTPNKPNNHRAGGPDSPGPVTGFSPLTFSIPTSMNDLSRFGTQALNLFTCGTTRTVDDVVCVDGRAGGGGGTVDGDRADADDVAHGSPLRRMTSVVGSPHYVAPEIISQPATATPSSSPTPSSAETDPTVGYDGTKADVWSAGVILYAMLFRSLPFGEDLLRCPRYQSFIKWYRAARRRPNSRRVSAAAALRDDYVREVAEELGPHWFFPSETSIESRDCIMAMLNPDPDERLSINQVLRHPWLVRQDVVGPRASRSFVDCASR